VLIIPARGTSFEVGMLLRKKVFGVLIQCGMVLGLELWDDGSCIGIPIYYGMVLGLEFCVDTLYFGSNIQVSYVALL
jgi:hypothetical protein